ncbi:MAG: thioredoxin [Planctomycetes bacterium]|nr:thioredoxin [Planctomycetota bacterium]MCW8136658.1 thioredoxin [Planctomycetota bacterium]
MAGPDTLEANASNFEKLTSGVSLVDFTATWCGPCQVLGPIVDRLATEFKGKVSVAKLDIDKNPEIAASFGVMGVPTLIFFKNGEVVDQHVGLLNEDALRKKLNNIAK